MEHVDHVNWDFISVCFTFGGFVLASLAYIFSPVRKGVDFHKEITKKGGEYNYYDMHADVKILMEAYNNNNSPQVQELKAKIARLEEEKEENYKNAMGEIKKLISGIQSQVQELKVQINKR